MNIGWTSIKIIYDKLLRDPMFIGITFESLIDYFIDFIHIVGTPNLFEEKIKTGTTISDYRAKLPDDFVEEIQISVKETLPSDINYYRQSKCAKYSTDTFALFQKELSSFEGSNYNLYNSNVSYRISDGYIYFNIKEGDLLIAYKSIKINDDEDSDDYGLPMIPDDPVFMNALQSYIEVQFLRMLWRAGKVTQQVYEDAKQIYAFKVGQYETHSHKITLAQMESISRMFTNIHQKTNEYSSRFKNIISK